MNHKTGPKERQPLKSWNKWRALKSLPVEQRVIYIKDILKQIEERQSEDNITVEKYLLLINNFFADWMLTQTFEEKINFEECCRFVWTQLNRLQIEQEYYLRLLISDYSSLNVQERFDKTIMIYVMNPSDNLTRMNLRRCIIELIRSNPKVFTYKSLYKYYDIITEVTQSMLIDEMIEIDILYLRQIYDNLPI